MTAQLPIYDDIPMLTLTQVLDALAHVRQLPHTEPHAAMIIADLLTLLRTDTDLLPVVEEARDYLAAARREHPTQCACFGTSVALDED